MKANPSVLQNLTEISKEEIEELKRIISNLIPGWEQTILQNFMR